MTYSIILYFLSLSTSVLLITLAQRRSWRLFEYLPGVVLIYAINMLIAQSGVWQEDASISQSYHTLKNNLLPAMLFLMLLTIDFKAFFRLGKNLLSAYLLAFSSLIVSFVAVFRTFGFSHEDVGIFSALGASWMGGTANMLAVGSALHVSENAMGYALVIDSVNYTFWVMLLLSLVGFAGRFNRFSGATAMGKRLEGIGCACSIGPKRYWLLLLLSLAVALGVQWLATLLTSLSQSTWIVLLASAMGIIASMTRLRHINGSGVLANTMLYLLVALIGSRAYFESAEGLGVYLLAGSAILTLHGILMLLGAKLLKLDLFSIGVASLANIGGVASAPLLAAAYDRTLIGVAVLMAIMGYLAGTLGGLFLARLLQMTLS